MPRVACPVRTRGLISRNAGTIAYDLRLPMARRDGYYLRQGYQGDIDVMEWYAGLTRIEQFLLAVAVFSTLVFVIQFMLTLLGLGDDADLDAGDEGLGLGDVFTLRNGISFLMGFSWGGLMAFDWGLTHPLLVGIFGAVLGTSLVGVNMLLLFGMAKLKHDGSIRLENAIAQQATVTLTIPESRSGVGKVLVPIQGRLKEYHAVTDGEALPRNAVVIVNAVAGSQLVVAAATQAV